MQSMQTISPLSPPRPSYQRSRDRGIRAVRTKTERQIKLIFGGQLVGDELEQACREMLEGQEKTYAICGMHLSVEERESKRNDSTYPVVVFHNAEISPDRKVQLNQVVPRGRYVALSKLLWDITPETRFWDKAEELLILTLQKHPSMKQAIKEMKAKKKKDRQEKKVHVEKYVAELRDEVIMEGLEELVAISDIQDVSSGKFVTRDNVTIIVLPDPRGPVIKIAKVPETMPELKKFEEQGIYVPQRSLFSNFLPGDDTTEKQKLAYELRVFLEAEIDKLEPIDEQSVDEVPAPEGAVQEIKPISILRKIPFFGK